MGRITSPAEYQSAKPKDREYALSDGKWEGLQMIVAPSGAKQWEFRYRIAGRRRKISVLGGYPKVDVKTARTWAEKWTRMVASGIDPAEMRMQERKNAATRQATDATTFKAIAEIWLTGYTRSKPLAPISRQHIQSIFDNDVFPFIGALPVGSISEGVIEEILERILAKGTIGKAHRTLWYCRAVFHYAIEKGLATKDPTFNKGRRLPVNRSGNRAALTDPAQVGKLVRDIRAYSGSLSTRAGLHLLLLLFTRPGEAQHAEWSEIDFERAIWQIPASRMKGPISKRSPHLVPLSRQALMLLRELRDLSNGSRFVFPSPQSHARPISNMTLTKALRSMGYGPKVQSAHGFRAIARTLLDERLRAPVSAIEAQLAHVVKDSNGTAYNRTQFLEERQSMMQRWADYLDTLAEE
jgi:integrase